MQSSKMKVIVTRKLPAPVELRMKELFDAELNDDDQIYSADALAAAMQRADVLVPTVTDQIDAALLDQAGDQLKLLSLIHI